MATKRTTTPATSKSKRTAKPRRRADPAPSLLALQERVVGEVVGSVAVAWERLELQYERYEMPGEVCEKYVANSFAGTVQTDVDLTIEALDALAELQRHPPAGQAEVWTWLVLSVDASGRFRFDFRYGIPPHTAAELDASS